MTHRWACILGNPLRHSLSPTLHNAAFAARGIDAQYELREVTLDQLATAVQTLRDEACLGANVTAPYKAAVAEQMDDLSAEAQLMGVVNTIVSASGRLVGDNTDALGLQRWMGAVGISVVGGDALVLGAGGAARATVLALTRLGARHVRVLNRTVEKAHRLADDLALAGVSWGSLDEATHPAERAVAVIVNATSLGHQDAAPIVDRSWYSAESVAIELVYNPPKTRFMDAARAAGARTENGLGMLVHQAALSFERWLGPPAPLQVYEDAANRALAAHA